jgi:N-acetylglucosamine kinase-like BadF-type ATPase
MRHLDGLGPLLGDHGGGYAIGLRALQATARANWHPRWHTAIASGVLAACRIRGQDTEREGLICYMAKPRDRSEIAGLARVVAAAAGQGDAVAMRIMREAAADLASTVSDLVDQLEIREEACPFVGTGGVIAGSDLYWEHLCAKVREFAPRFQFLRSDLPPVVGVALGALARMAGVDYEIVKRRLFDDMRARMEAEKSAAGSGCNRGK